LRWSKRYILSQLYKLNCLVLLEWWYGVKALGHHFEMAKSVSSNCHCVGHHFETYRFLHDSEFQCSEVLGATFRPLDAHLTQTPGLVIIGRCSKTTGHHEFKFQRVLRHETLDIGFTASPLGTRVHRWVENLKPLDTRLTFLPLSSLLGYGWVLLE